MRDVKTHRPSATLIPALDFGKVERLLVFHLDEGISTPIAVLPHRLERASLAKRFEITNPDDFRAIYEALLASEPSSQPDSGIDARWGTIFVAKDGTQLLAAYVDGFGIQGVIESKVVSFAFPKFLQWLKGRFANDAR